MKVFHFVLFLLLPFTLCQSEQPHHWVNAIYPSGKGGGWIELSNGTRWQVKESLPYNFEVGDELVIQYSDEEGVIFYNLASGGAVSCSLDSYLRFGEGVVTLGEIQDRGIILKTCDETYWLIVNADRERVSKWWHSSDRMMISRVKTRSDMYQIINLDLAEMDGDMRRSIALAKPL